MRRFNTFRRGGIRFIQFAPYTITIARAKSAAPRASAEYRDISPLAFCAGFLAVSAGFLATFLA